MNPLDDPEELGRRLSACRGYAGFSRTYLADLLEVSDSVVRKREVGKGLGRSHETRADI